MKKQMEKRGKQTKNKTKSQTKSKTKKILFEILGILVITRIAIVIISYLSTLVIKAARHAPVFVGSNFPLNLFFKWDSNWYMSIVEYGYSYIPGKESNIAFFPLYPLLVKLVSFVFGNPELVGFVISNVALFFACFYLYKLVRLDYKEESAMMSVFYMLIFPVTFFFSIFYTEGLFLFLAISCFYYARKKQWLIASMLGFFLSLTRTLGVFIFIPVLIEYLNIDFKSWKIDFKKIKKDILYLLLIPLGLFIFMFFSYLKFNDAFAFLNTQLAWGRRLVIPFAPLIMDFYYSLFYQIILRGFAIFVLIMILYLLFSKVRFSYSIYAFLLLAVCLSTSSLDSIPRLVSVIFPIYLGMALASRKEYLKYIFIISSIMLLTLFLILFVNGYWFT